jgi:hypothetical protein
MSPDDIFAKKITTYLDHGVADLKAGTAYRLQLARRKPWRAWPTRSARRQRRWPSRGPGPRTAPRAAAVESGGRGWLWLGIALIVAAGFGYQQWQAYQQLNDIEETDAAILSSELPIDAYLDRGFQNWLKRASFDE